MQDRCHLLLSLNIIENVIPGAAQTIITWASEETHFRRRMLETDAVHQRRMDWADVVRSFFGLGAGATIAVIGLIGSFKLAFAGYQLAAAVIGALDIASITGIFVYGTIRQGKNKITADEHPTSS
jgi:uncharacterized membrane protein